jgi:hypothetical protein
VIRVMRLAGAARRDPGVEAWLRAHDDALGDIARRGVAILRDGGGDVRELLLDGQPTACAPAGSAPYAAGRSCAAASR